MSTSKWWQAMTAVTVMCVAGTGCAMRDGSRATAIPAKGGLVAADLDGKVLGQRDEYVIVDLASGWASESYPVQVARSPAALDNPAEFKTTKLLLRKISKGTYAVGSPEHEVGHRFDERLHEVVLSRDYYVSVYEITQKQWNLVMGNSPSAYRGDTLPVENVSWTLVRGGKWPGGDPAQGSFVGRLRQRTQGALFDLPTEAQWETACRAGTLTALSNNRNLRFPDRDATVDPVAWHFHNVPSGTHQEVGTREANGWGLYDMHGNVWEMCLDVYADYPVSVVTDPVGGPEPKHAQTARRVVRGGGYRNHAVSTFRSAYRTFELPGTRKGDVGFRLVLNVVNGL